MIVYLAIGNQTHFESEDFKGADILSSFFYCSHFDRVTSAIPTMRNFLLDSGVFSFINSGKRFNDEYIHRYAEYIKANNITSYVELDVDQIIGVKETRKLRDKLENLVGWPSIPVWHTIRGKDSFLQDCRDYKRICLGFFLTEGLPTQLTEKYTPWFIEKAHENNCLIHGLGFTKTKLLPYFHFDSVDSSTFIFADRAGITFKFDTKTHSIKTTVRPKGKKISKRRDITRHAYFEWRKYQDWAIRYLPTVS